jgi:hypothetical protein
MTDFSIGLHPHFRHGPNLAALAITLGLWLEVAIVGGVFGYGVARESKSRLVRITGYLLALSFPVIPIGVLFSYGVAQESRSSLVRIAGSLLAASIPLSIIAGNLSQSPALAYSVIVILGGFFSFNLSRKGIRSPEVRLNGCILAAGIPLALIFGILSKNSRWTPGLLWTLIILLGACFSYAVGRESTAPRVRLSGNILSVTAVVVVVVGWVLTAFDV